MRGTWFSGAVAGLVILAVALLSMVLARLEKKEGATWGAMRRRLGRTLGFLAAFGVLLGGVAVLLSLLSSPPFSPGQGLGVGLALGLCSGLLWALFALWAMAAGWAVEGTHLVASWQASLLPLAAVGWSLLTFQGVLASRPSDFFATLMGWLAGVGLATWIVGGTLQLGAEEEQPEASLANLLEMHLLSTTLLVLATGLGWLSPEDATRRSLPHLLLAYWVLVGGSVVPLGRWPVIAWPALMGLGLGGAKVLLSRWEADPSVSFLLLSGALGGVLLWDLTPEVERENLLQRFRMGLVGALLVVGLVAVGFLLLRGFGIAMAALGMLLAALGEAMEHGQPLQARPLSSKPVLFSPLFSLAFFLLFRLYYERHPLPEYRADLYFHYTFLGLFLGVLLPLAMATLAWEVRGRLRQRREEGSLPIGPWLDWWLTGGLLGLSPLLILCLWGTRGGAGMAAGLVLAGWLLLVGRWAGLEGPLRALLLLAMWVLVQLPPLVAPIALWGREERLWLLAGAAMIGGLWGWMRSRLLGPFPMGEGEVLAGSQEM